MGGNIVEKALSHPETPQSCVVRFRQACDLHVGNTPKLVADHDLLLHLSLLREELGELEEAIALRDTVEVADGATDLIYVALGLLADCGMDFEELFGEVQRSNMTKMQPDGTVFKSDAGKILKPATYEPPNLTQFLEAV